MSKIEVMKEPYPDKLTINIMHPLFKQWFFNKFDKFSEPQKYAIYNIHCRINTLVSSPTGSGKTLCAFGAILNELIGLSESNELQDKIYCVYVSPLKALSRDIEKNLKEPLSEIEELYGKKLGIRIGVRTGDTEKSERAKMSKLPPHILITTPESLSILLSSKNFVNHFTDVNWAIIDEIHSLAENKRGVDLSLSLELLNYLSPQLARIGLSATVSPLDEVAKFLVGQNRDCKIVDTQSIKKLDLKVLSPVNDLINTSFKELQNKTYELINELVMAHKTTLVFTNTRAGTERVVNILKDKYPKNYYENIGAHHGSLSKEHRTDIESRLREGKLKVIVCSTSLELGIDIGFIDLVICLGSPKSVSRMLQRIGRSGHRLHDTTKGVIIVMGRDDLVECSVMMKCALEKKIDKIHIPMLALDILAQKIYGFSIFQKWNENELFNLIKGSYCYSGLDFESYNQILDYLAGNFAELEDRSIYAKIWRKDGMIGSRGKMARVIYQTNLGTIPDQSGVIVKLGNYMLGTIDEGFLERLKKRDIFVLGGATYEFRFSKGNVASVVTSIGKPPTVPSWFSEMLPLSFDLSLEIQKFRKLTNEKFESNKKKDEIIEFIGAYLYTEKKTSEAIYNYFKEQYKFSKIPHEKKIIIEFYNDGKIKRAIFHSLFGRRVNDCLSRLVAFSISRSEHKDVEIGVNDNGFMISYNGNINFGKILKLLKPEDIIKIMENSLNHSEILKRRFRHCASRAMMILRSYKGNTKRVGKLQVSSDILFSTVNRIDPDFFIIMESKREIMEDQMDINNAKLVLNAIGKNQIFVEEFYTEIPSPFSFNLIIEGYSDLIKMEDKTEFLKRMHSYVLAKIALEKKESGVSYKELWEEEDKNKEKQMKEDIEKKELALEFLEKTNKYLSINENIYSNIQDLIKGKREGFNRDFKIFIFELTKIPYPKKWPKELVEYLDKIKNEMI